MSPQEWQKQLDKKFMRFLWIVTMAWAIAVIVSAWIRFH